MQIVPILLQAFHENNDYIFILVGYESQTTPYTRSVGWLVAMETSVINKDHLKRISSQLAVSYRLPFGTIEEKRVILDYCYQDNELSIILSDGTVYKWSIYHSFPTQMCNVKGSFQPSRFFMSRNKLMLLMDKDNNIHLYNTAS